MKATSLDREDWRFYAIDSRGEGIISLATTEFIAGRSGRKWSFALPSATAMYLDVAAKAHKERRAINLADIFGAKKPSGDFYPDEHKELFDFFQLFSTEIIFSFSALECFANEHIPSESVR